MRVNHKVLFGCFGSLSASLLISTFVYARNVDNVALADCRKALQQVVTFRDKFYSAVAKKDQAWIVGYYGTILHLKLTNNGPWWEKQNSSTTLPLFGVSFSDEHNGLIVGKKGLILRTENGGVSWKAVAKQTDKHLFSVCLVNSKLGWAVGEFGTILHTNDGGKTWQDQSLKDEDINLNKCLFLDVNTGWIVGEFATILYTQDGGTSWHFKKKDEMGVSLYDIMFKTNDEGLISGQNGSLYQTLDGGQRWELIKLPREDNLLGVGILDGKYCVVGLRGAVIEEGQNGSFEPVKGITVPDWLHTVIGLSSGLGIIAGDHSRLLYSTQSNKREWAIMN